MRIDCDNCGKACTTFTMTGKSVPEPRTTTGTRAEIVCMDCAAARMGAYNGGVVATLGPITGVPVDVQCEMLDALESVVAFDLRIERSEKTTGGEWLDIVARIRAVVAKAKAL